MARAVEALADDPQVASRLTADPGLLARLRAFVADTLARLGFKGTIGRHRIAVRDAVLRALDEAARDRRAETDSPRFSIAESADAGYGDRTARIERNWERLQRRADVPEPMETVLRTRRFSAMPPRTRMLAAFRHVMDHLRDEYTNESTGWTIRVSKSSAKELSGKRDDPWRLDALDVLPDLIRRAVLGDSHPDTKGRPEVKAVHHLYAPMRAPDAGLETGSTRSRPDRRFVVELTVFELQDGRKLYNHDLVEISDPAESPPGGRVSDSPESIAGSENDTPPEADIRFSIAPLVESEAFKRWFGDSKVVDKDGKPLVVYHGGRRFNRFDAAAQPQSGAAHPAFFFTSSRANAMFYEDGEIKQVYLSIENPRVFEGEEASEHSPADLVRETFAQVMRGEAEWDGVIIRDVVDGRTRSDIYAVFPDADGASAQIKSATGNRGTFDPENPDIRFSVGRAGDGRKRGRLGPIFERFKGRARSAINFLRRQKEGEAVGVLTHPDVRLPDGRPAPISLVVGRGGEQGMGIRHIDEKHPGDLDALPDVWNRLRLNKAKSDAHRAVLDGDGYRAVVHDRYNDQPPHWVVTFFARDAQGEGSATGRRSPVPGSAVPGGDGTPPSAEPSPDDTPGSGPRFSIAPLVESEAFKRWFGDSKVVDEDGKPLVVYHGTQNVFTAFNTVADGDLGSHFGTRDQAAAFAGGSAYGRMMPVYLSIQNPVRLIDTGEWSDAEVLPQLERLGLIDSVEEAGERSAREILQQAGYDGVVYMNRREGFGKPLIQRIGQDAHDRELRKPMSDAAFRRLVPEATDSYIAFDPAQIKSATGNRGTFDPGNPDIRFSVERAEDGTRSGPFGPIYTRFKGRFRNALNFLRRERDGEAVGVLDHPDVPGPISLVWGKVGTAANRYEDGYGIAKMDVKHPGVVDVLPSILPSLRGVRSSADPSKIVLRGDEHTVVVQHGWNGRGSYWLVTAYRKTGEGPALGQTAGVPETPVAGRGETSSPAKPSPDDTPEGGPRFSIAPPVESEAFKRWFKDSKVVDEDGKPLVVYHGSPDVRGIFAKGFGRYTSDGTWFAAADYRVADSYADDRRAFDYQNAEPQTIPLYLSIRNPLIVDAEGRTWKHTQKYIDQARAAGHDGIIIRNTVDYYLTSKGSGQKPTTVYAWFMPSQAKSAVQGQLRSRIDGKPIEGATGNRGTFDPGNPDIRFSVKPVEITGEEITADPRGPSKQQARAFLRDNFQGRRFVNDETGERWAFTSRSANHILTWAHGVDERRLFAAIPEIVKRARLQGSIRVQDAEQPNLKSFRRFAAEATVAGRPYTVEVQVKTFDQSRQPIEGLTEFHLIFNQKAKKAPPGNEVARDEPGLASPDGEASGESTQEPDPRFALRPSTRYTPGLVGPETRTAAQRPEQRAAAVRENLYRLRRLRRLRREGRAAEAMLSWRGAIDELAGALNMRPPLRNKRGMRGTALGYYTPWLQTIRLGRPDNLRTFVHEVGHYLNDLLFPAMKVHGRSALLVFPKSWRPEMIALGKALYGTRKPAGGYAKPTRSGAARRGWAGFIGVVYCLGVRRYACSVSHHGVLDAIRNSARRRGQIQIFGLADTPARGHVAGRMADAAAARVRALATLRHEEPGRDPGLFRFRRHEPAEREHLPRHDPRCARRRQLVHVLRFPHQLAGDVQAHRVRPGAHRAPGRGGEVAPAGTSSGPQRGGAPVRVAA